jgi:multiple sugar transport system permease protein
MASATSGPIDRRDLQFGRRMAAPALSALLLVILFPIFFALYTSVFDYTLIHPVHDDLVGLAHYRSALGNVEFGHSLWVTLRFVAAVVILEFLLGFTIALMLNTVERGKNVYYLILLLPLLINPVVVGLIWRMFLHPVLGIVNYLLGLIGIGAVNWLGDPSNAFWTVVLVDIWHQVSFMVICCWPDFRRCRASRTKQRAWRAHRRSRPSSTSLCRCCAR